MINSYFTNRHGVRIYYRAIRCQLGDTDIYRFELAPVSGEKPAEPVWRRSAAFFWTEREAFNTARDIAREAARFDAPRLDYRELSEPQPAPAKPRDVIKPPKPAKQLTRLIDRPLRPAAPIRQYKDD